jgi:hypothetical protein
MSVGDFAPLGREKLGRQQMAGQLLEPFLPPIELAAGEHSWLLANTCSRARAYQQQSRPIDIITERTVAHRVEDLDAAHEPLRGRGLAAYALRRQVLVIDKYVFSDSFDEQGHAACSKWQGSELASKVRLSASIARGLAHRNSTSAVSLRRICRIWSVAAWVLRVRIGTIQIRTVSNAQRAELTSRGIDVTGYKIRT